MRQLHTTRNSKKKIHVKIKEILPKILTMMLKGVPINYVEKTQSAKKKKKNYILNPFLM